MNKLAEHLIDELYKDRETWGVGVLVRTLQKQSLRIGGERTLKRAAEILNSPYVELKIGGNLCRSYSKDVAKEIVNYILETPRNVRAQDWLELHPEEEIKRTERRQQNLINKKVKRQLELNQSSQIKIWRCSAYLRLSKRTIYRLCHQLKISIIDNEMDRKDFEKLKLYINENYSDDSHKRSRQLAIETWMKNGSNEKRSIKTSATRKQNKEINRRKLEKELGVKCYTDIEASQFIGKNNSTLISGMKLLELPMYKIGGTYIYDENSLIKLKNFYNNKNGLKGQIARLFEEYIRYKKVDYICEKTFPGCYWHEDSKHPLRFDYYFSKYNLVVEVQGNQHFHPSSMGSDLTEEQIMENFKGLKERDQVKKDYCLKNNINFIEIITKEDFKKFDYIIHSIERKNLHESL